MIQQSSHLSLDEVLKKAQHYCAYQERCVEDVKKKLLGWGLGDMQILKIINKLEKEGFLSNIRFTELFVRSKVNQNRWGKFKIEAALKLRKIPNEIIRDQLVKINDEVYLANLKILHDYKFKELEQLEPFKREQKLKLYLQSKGYEPEIIFRVLKQTINKEVLLRI